MVQCKGGRARVVPMLVASLSFAAAGLGASGSARAMNFCAAPALQASETTGASRASRR